MVNPPQELLDAVLPPTKRWEDISDLKPLQFPSADILAVTRIKVDRPEVELDGARHPIRNVFASEEFLIILGTVAKLAYVGQDKTAKAQAGLFCSVLQAMSHSCFRNSQEQHEFEISKRKTRPCRHLMEP